MCGKTVDSSGTADFVDDDVIDVPLDVTPPLVDDVTPDVAADNDDDVILDNDDGLKTISVV